MKSSHTPGPWDARIYGGWDALRVWSDIGSIALLQHHDSGPDEAEANARLIAASPDMLEALMKARSFIENQPVRTANLGLITRLENMDEVTAAGKILYAINDAIAKATGSTPC